MQETWTTGPPSEGGDNGRIIDAAIKHNFTELYSIAKDASVYGFSTTASASDNVIALQAALDEEGIITVRAPGTYDLNDTVYIGSDTALVCSPGVIFRKVATYVNILLNKGALTRIYDENILLMGLEISVNGFQKNTGGPVETFTPNVGFFYVRYLKVVDFKCLDIPAAQFCMSIVRWEYAEFRNIHLEGLKDGISIGVGHDGLWDHIYCDTFDDGMKLYTTDYPDIITETGDIYNVTIRDYTDVQVGAPAGYSLRLLYGSWADWSNGNSYKKGDMCVNGGNIYALMLSDSGFPVVAANAPVHSSGSVKGADGITWRWLQAGSFYKGDIYNITLDNIRSSGTRGAMIGAIFIDDDVNTRSVYPGTETLSKAYNITVLNSIITDNPLTVFQTVSNVKDITFTNCVIDNINTTITGYTGWDYNDLLTVRLIGCLFKNKTDHVIAYNDMEGQTIDITMSACISDNATVTVNDAGTDTPIRLINRDLPFLPSRLSLLTPENGDMCRTTESLAIYKAGIGWMDVGCTMYGPELFVNGQFLRWGASWPVNWAGPAFDANNYVEESSGKLRLVADGAGFHIYQLVGTSGKTYMLMVNCTAITGAGVRIYQGTGTMNVTSTGITGLIIVASHTYVYINSLGATDITLDWVSFKKVLAP